MMRRRCERQALQDMHYQRPASEVLQVESGSDLFVHVSLGLIAKTLQFPVDLDLVHLEETEPAAKASIGRLDDE